MGKGIEQGKRRWIHPAAFQHMPGADCQRLEGFQKKVAKITEKFFLKPADLMTILFGKGIPQIIPDYPPPVA